MGHLVFLHALDKTNQLMLMMVMIMLMLMMILMLMMMLMLLMMLAWGKWWGGTWHSCMLQISPNLPPYLNPHSIHWCGSSRSSAGRGRMRSMISFSALLFHPAKNSHSYCSTLTYGGNLVYFIYLKWMMNKWYKWNRYVTIWRRRNGRKNKWKNKIERKNEWNKCVTKGVAGRINESNS